MDADAAAAGDHGRDHPARGRRRAESADDAGWSFAVLLHYRDGVPWRVGAHPSGGQISDRLLCRAVVRRHDRRIVRRAGRAVYLFVDRGISDPAGPGGAVPAGRRIRALVALEPLVLAVARGRRAGADRALIYDR